MSLESEPTVEVKPLVGRECARVRVDPFVVRASLERGRIVLVVLPNDVDPEMVSVELVVRGDCPEVSEAGAYHRTSIGLGEPLSSFVAYLRGSTRGPVDLRAAIVDLKARAVRRAREAVGEGYGAKTRAARLLGVAPSTYQDYASGTGAARGFSNLHFGRGSVDAGDGDALAELLRFVEGPEPPVAIALHDALRRVVYEAVARAIELADGNVSRAARMIGIPGSTLRDLLRGYKVTPELIVDGDVPASAERFCEGLHGVRSSVGQA